MAEKILNTRVQLKYDSYANWTSTTLGDDKGANFVLKAGEIGICYLPTDYSEKQVVGSQPPQILMKVGNGSSKFSELPWVSAKAADVYEWAKQAALPVTKVGNGNVVAGIEWDEASKGIKFTTASVATSEGMEQLANRVTTIENTYATDAELAAAVEAINGAKADKATTLAGYGITDAYTKAEVDNEFTGVNAEINDINSLMQDMDEAKADKATTLAGYGIADAYTKTAIDEMEQALQKDIDDNVTAINAINNADTGILKQAKDYTDAQIADLDFYSEAETDAEISGAINELKTTVINPLSEEVAKKASQTDLNAVSAVANAAATQTALAEEIARAKAAEKVNADAIERLTNGVSQEEIDGVNDLINYVNEHGPEVEQMQRDIAANTAAVSAEASRADTEEKRLAGLISTNDTAIKANADAIAALSGESGKVAAAEKADTASSLDAAGIAQVKAIVVDKASDADTLDGHDSTYFATAEQGAKADTAVQPAALNDYYTKTEADAEFMNAGEVDAKIAALDLANTYDAKGAAATAEANAIAHANGLAGNYATAAQGAKADSALQEITTTANNGLKVTNKNQIDIDTDVIFVFNCGDSQTVL